MQFFDTLQLGDAKLTADGYLIADVRAARIGIQTYSGQEVGRPDLGFVRVYRPEAEVFHGDAMASFTSIPVTLDHPPEEVKPKNWQRYARGFTGESVARDGGFIRVPLAVKDQVAIDAVRAGKKELSCGYTCDLKFEAGETPEGDAYDAIQTNIRGNHLAIVSAGRAGSECRIGDEAEHQHQKDLQMADKALKTVTVDGIPVEVTDQGATVIETLKSRLADTSKALDDAKSGAEKALNDTKAAHATSIADKDKELGTKDAEIEKLKANQIDDSKLDKLVSDRADVLTKARAISDKVQTSGKSNADVRRGAVAAKLGDEKVKDRSDDYVLALFDSLAADAKPGGRDPVRDVLSNGTSHSVGDSDKAYDAMLAGMSNAWKNSQDRKESV